MAIKLLNHSKEEPLLPKPLDKRPSPVQKWLTSIIQLLFSEEGITCSVGLLLVFFLTGLVSLNYLTQLKSIDKSGISQGDFFAPTRLEIVDKEATQRKIDRTKQTIPPVYQPNAPHNQDIENSLESLLSALKPLAIQATSAHKEKYALFTQVTQNKPNADKVYGQYFQKPIPEANWEQLSQASRIGLARILKTGFTEADEQLKRSSIIQYNIPDSGFNSRYRGLVYFLLDATLEPNLILDEVAMRQKQTEVAEQIYQKPEIKVYARKEKIIAKGEKVSAIQLAALQKMGKLTPRNWNAIGGAFLLALLFVFTVWSYLHHFKKRQFFTPAYAALVATLITLPMLFFHVIDGTIFGNLPTLMFPLGAIALTLAIFTTPLLSVLVVTLLVFFIDLTLRTDFSTLAVLLFGSYMGIYIVGKHIQYSNRSKLIYAGFYIGLTNALILFAISLLKPSYGDMSLTAPTDMLSLSLLSLKMIVLSFMSGLLSGVLTIGWLPLFEGIFGLITPYTLMELGNHDQPLLKRMQFEAPGTFHHSLMVATLSEAAAEAIGANALLTRVGCLYHDIGKMKRPLFFIENQAYFGVENPHDKLTPRLSKMVITAHPRDSLEMAKQHKLPEMITKFMTEHHGTLTAGYFYNKACQQEGAENVNKAQFRYPGPKPGSRETAIVMLADACESAVRSMKSPSVAQVEERIDKIIQQRIDEEQFDQCPLTFSDLNQIKQTFARVLRGIQHNRIEYQQNMMRELGRKLPAVNSQEQAHLQNAMNQAQKSEEK